MKKISILTFAALAAMTPADLFNKAKDGVVKVFKAVETAQDKLAGSIIEAAKIVAAMKRRYTEQINSKAIPADTTFKKYFKQNAGGELPGRVEALAALFNSLVLTNDANGKPLLSEEAFDNAAPDWLEKANAIIAAAQKQFGENWKGSDDVLDTLNALSKPGDAGKKLKEIRKRQKGETGEGEETAGEKNAVRMTPALAAQYLCAALADAAKLKEEEHCAALSPVRPAARECLGPPQILSP